MLPRENGESGGRGRERAEGETGIGIGTDTGTGARARTRAGARAEEVLQAGAERSPDKGEQRFPEASR